jgi:hypothetical protein
MQTDVLAEQDLDPRTLEARRFDDDDPNFGIEGAGGPIDTGGQVQTGNPPPPAP